jgi:predicted RecB family nuclease
MTCRYDVSAVPLQGAYAAKRCPVRAQNDTLQPTTQLEPDPFLERLFARGRAFEAELSEELLASQPQAVVITGWGEEAQAATLEAMSSGAPLISNALLIDEAGRRVARPDLLVRSETGGYRPVDIKWHAVLDLGTNATPPARLSTLNSLGLEGATFDPAWTLRKREEDALQLAHYQHTLQAHGQAAPDGCFGGIIGTERRVVWYDLDQPMWRTPSVSAKSKLRSTMERYEFEFDFRLDIIAVSRLHLSDPTVPLLVVPVRCDECPSCPWRDYCGSILREPPGDISLLPRVGWTHWKAHRDRGVHNLQELAALDHWTAHVVAEKVDAQRLLHAVAGLPPETPLRHLEGAPLKPRTLEILSMLGITTVGDVRTIDTATARYSDLGMAALPEQIDLARAALGPEAVYRRRGIGALTVPRADVEVDVDMENTEAGVYLWGALLGQRHIEDSVPEYHPFATWDPLSPEEETRNSMRFWMWLLGLRAEAHSKGKTFAAYCWNAAAENQPLRRLGRMAGISDEVEVFLSSDEWVDLLRVWDSQLITGGPSSLKTIAQLIGSQWEVEDPGGVQAIIRYELAMGDDPSLAKQAREWLLTYNHGDVLATRGIREWLTVSRVPSVGALGS